MLTTNPNHFKIGSRLALRWANRSSTFMIEDLAAKSIDYDDIETQHWLSGGYSVMKEREEA